MGGWMNAGVQCNGDRDLQGLEDETERNGVKWDRVTVSFRLESCAEYRGGGGGGVEKR